MHNKRILIIGAGISGLTIGYELIKKGHQVILVEKEKDFGGLARSFCYDGFTFDVGPHRFHTENKRALSFIERILKDEAISISRDSKVYFKGKYHEWPLRPGILFNLPLSIQVKAGLDLLFRVSKKTKDAHNFQEYILNNYGVTLFNCFFKEYTQKFLDIPLDSLDVDWAKTGMRFAIINKNLSYTTLWEVLRLTIKPLTVCTTFLYAKRGIVSFCEKLAQYIVTNGGRILRETQVKDINHTSQKINSVITDKETFRCDNLVWTGPIGEICRFLYSTPPNLKYVSLILYNVLLNTKVKKHFQWCYFGEKDIIFNRITNPSLFGPNLAPKDKTGLCVEVTCRENDQVWSNPQRLSPRIKEDLVKVQLIDSHHSISSIYIKHIPNAYPIYDLGYRKKLDSALGNFARFKNLTLAGRTGLFWYNNMDDCIDQALDIAEKVAQE